MPITIVRLTAPLLPNKAIDEVKNSGSNQVAIITHNRNVANKILTLNVLKSKSRKLDPPICTKSKYH